MAWLVRCHTFIADIQKADMITAFKNSEIISTWFGKKMPFHSKITKSQAVLIATDSISGALALRDDINNEKNT